MEAGLVIPEKVLARLTKKELTELEKYRNKPGLAITIQAQFFELFVNGNSCEEIHRLNSNFPFGAIVRARIEGLWDQRKDDMLASALDAVRARVEQTQVAAVHFNADLLAAAHKQFGDRLKKYMQTGDENVLGDVKIETLKQYRDAIEMWLKVTGQDSKKTITLQTPQDVASNVGAKVDRPPTSEEAETLFGLLLEKERG
jgi:hypothetical protein